jgi:ketosteroid isomerase-like protein
MGVVEEAYGALVEHPNVIAVRRLLAAFSAQDRTVIESILDPECVWRVPGDNALAGEYVGRAAVLGLFGRLKRMMTSPVRFDLLEITALGERVISYQYGVVVIAGKTLRMKERLIYRFRDGQVVEVEEYQFDQASFDRTFSRAVEFASPVVVTP